MRSNKTFLMIPGVLLGITLLSGILLSAPKANADSSATVNLTVNIPTACTLTPASTSLTNTIAPGSSEEIGTAKLKAICNDASGLAIYAAGYTNNEYGNNYLVTDLGDSHKIATGIAASPTSSQWNMTISNDMTVQDTYVATISDGTNGTEDFSHPHIIPLAYTKVASYPSITDKSIGVNLNARFDAYIAPNQVAGTYEGKVKFMLVHPATAPTPNDIVYSTKDITVTFNAYEGGYLDDGVSTTNVVTYHGECETERAQEFYTTPNVANSGTKLRSLTTDGFDHTDDSYYYGDSINIPEASKLRITIDYDFEINGDNNPVHESGFDYYENAFIVIDTPPSAANLPHSFYGTGTQTITIDGNDAYIGILIADDATIDTAHDYGYHATVTPLDENGDPIVDCRCEWTITEGEYIGRNVDWDNWLGGGMMGSYKTIESWLNTFDGTELTLIRPRPER